MHEQLLSPLSLQSFNNSVVYRTQFPIRSYILECITVCAISETHLNYISAGINSIALGLPLHFFSALILLEEICCQRFCCGYLSYLLLVGRILLSNILLWLTVILNIYRLKSVVKYSVVVNFHT